jgi:hypothetical protein
LHNLPIRGKQYVLFTSLVSQAAPSTFQSNPTLAAGDVKVSLDGGTLNNLGTLPTVAPASGKMVKITVSAAEMDADNVTVVFSDAAGAEWCDQTLNIQPSGLILAGTVNDAGATTTVFKTTLTNADDFINGAFVVFMDGALQGESRKISDYSNTNGQITLATALTSAPADTTPFIVLGRSE